MKHPQSQMIWGAMSAPGTAGLYFMEKNTIMNSEKYLAMLKEKLNIHINVHQCNVFMQDGAPCHYAKKVTVYLKCKKNRDLAMAQQQPRSQSNRESLVHYER